MKRGLHTLPQKPSSSQCIGVTVDHPVRRNSSRRCRRGKWCARCSGTEHVDVLTRGETVNAERYCETLQKLRLAIGCHTVVPIPGGRRLRHRYSEVGPKVWQMSQFRGLDVRPLDSFPAFHGTRRFNTEFTRALNLFLSLARPISPHRPIPPLQDPSKYYPPTYVLVFLVVSFPLAFPPIIIIIITLLSFCYLHLILLQADPSLYFIYSTFSVIVVIWKFLNPFCCLVWVCPVIFCIAYFKYNLQPVQCSNKHWACFTLQWTVISVRSAPF
jgi:hypothetical protein